MASLNVKGSLVAGLLAAIVASMCCVGPLALLGLGVSGAWIASLSALEPVRPLFIAATLLFLGLAFRRLYMVPQVCEPATPCADPRTLGRQRAVFWLATIALGALLAVPLAAPLFY